MSPAYALKIKLSWAEHSCLWADDRPTTERLGYCVDPDTLPLSDETCAEISRLCERFTGTLPDLADPEADPRALMLGWEPDAVVFAPAVMRLAARLRTELGEAFRVEHDFAPPPAFTAGWNRRWTALAAGASTAMALLMAAVAVWIGRPPAAFEPDRAGVLIAAFGAFTLLFVATAITYAAASFDKADVLVIDWRGVADRRLSRNRIDWTRLSAVTVVDGAIALVARRDGRRSIPFPANPLWAVVRGCARYAGPAEFTLKPQGLATDEAAMLGALQLHGIGAAGGSTSGDADAAGALGAESR